MRILLIYHFFWPDTVISARLFMFAGVQTGETRQYGNIILQKGVIL